ncbi:hypothetical protein MHI18_08660 [Peribacillus sp. FSL H8-0477]
MSYFKRILIVLAVAIGGFTSSGYIVGQPVSDSTVITNHYPNQSS